MRSILIILAVVSGSSIALGGRIDTLNPQNVIPATGQPKFDDVDWDLSKGMGISKHLENVVISPISLRVVLGLLLDAANGTTADEIAKFLQIDAQHLTDKTAIRKHFKEMIQSLNKLSDSTLTSDVVTKIFVDHRVALNDTYLKLIKENYDTETQSVDFTRLSDVIAQINKWASGATHGHIQDLLSEGDTDPSAIMLLLNVIFFNGLWTHPFDEKDTKNGSFYLSSTSYIQTPMMNAQHELIYGQTFDNEYQLLRMPYQGGTFAMYFVLPRSRTGLDDLIKNVNPAKIHSLMKTMVPTVVNVTIPRFRFSYNTGLKNVLNNFNIKTMFTPAADFSNMENHSNTNLQVSNILQKAGIEVNEKGSTAYASTVAEVENKIRESTIEFKADRPFLFFIEEDTTRTVVFVGKVCNPGISQLGKPQSPQKVTETLSSPGSYTPPYQTKPINNVPQDRYGSPTTEQIEDTSDSKMLSKFDISILESLGFSNDEKNVVISPASIKIVLGLLLHAAEGKTASEIQYTLHLSENKLKAETQLERIHRAIMNMTAQFSLKSANGIFVANGLKIKQKFEEIAVYKYFTYIDTINVNDPSTETKKINNWISKKTEGLIPTALESGIIQPETKLLLVNAMHFKGKWVNGFPKEATRATPFHNGDIETSCVNMMSLRASLKNGYNKEINADLVKLPFQEPGFSFIIVLPREKSGVKILQRNLLHVPIIDLLNDLDSSEVTLSLPKFEAKFETELSSDLKDLRIRDLFSDQSKLSNLIEGNSTLKVDAVIHKAFIQVDEEGAKAGAATVSSVVPLMSPRESKVIVADHPFLFFIYNSKSKIILFEGVINKPDQINVAKCTQASKLEPIKTTLDNIYNIDIRLGHHHNHQKNAFITTIAPNNEEIGPSIPNNPQNPPPIANPIPSNRYKPSVTNSWQQSYSRNDYSQNHASSHQSHTTASSHSTTYNTGQTQHKPMIDNDTPIRFI